MNEEAEKLIQLLGEKVTVEEINNNENIKGIVSGKIKINDKVLKAYVLEENLQVDTKYTGKIVSVIETKGKEEKQLVVTEEKSKIYYQDIKGYFNNIDELKEAKFNCLYEKSAGAIIYKLINNTPHYLIVYSKKNFPGFPKGHIEFGESEQGAAKREIFEEVGITATLKDDFRTTISYIVYDTPINKEVIFYLAEISDNEKINIDSNEINEYKFMTFNEAKEVLTEQSINALSEAKYYIENRCWNL